MNQREAVELIASAVVGVGPAWADVGAGDGTFTRALLECLGDEARLFAVDRDARSLGKLRRWAAGAGANVVTIEADFTQPFELPGIAAGSLDGILIANALHYVPDPDVVLAQLAELVRRGGRVVIIEYDRRAANRWIPYPIDAPRLPEIARAAGLSEPRILARMASAFGGTLYVAAADCR